LTIECLKSKSVRIVAIGLRELTFYHAALALARFYFSSEQLNLCDFIVVHPFELGSTPKAFANLSLGLER